jgi:hypothetical protein
LTVLPVVRVALPVSVRLVEEVVNVPPPLLLKSVPRTKVLLLTSRVPPVGVPPPVNVRVFDPEVRVPLPAGLQALVTERFVDPPRSRSKLPISRLATLTVLPVVRTVLPESVRLVEEVVKVPEDELKSAPRTKEVLVASKVAAPPNVPPPIKVSVFDPGVKVPPVGFQALVTERSVDAPWSRVKPAMFRVATLTVFPVVKTVLPDRVRLVEEVVNVPPPLLLKSVPRTRVLLLTSNVPPVGVPPPVNVRVFDPEVKVPLPAGLQALVTDKFVDPPRSRSKLPMSRVATLTVLPVVRTVLPVRVRFVEEVVRVPDDVLKSVPRIRVLLGAFKVAAPPNVPPLLKVRVFDPRVKVPLVGFQAPGKVRLVPAPRVRVLLPKFKEAKVGVPPVVKVELPDKVNEVLEVVKVPPVVVILAPRTSELSVISKVAAPPNVPPPLKVNVFDPGVKVPPVGFQALVTERSVDTPWSRVKPAMLRVATLTVLPVVKVALPVRVRFVEEVVNVPPPLLSKSVPRIKVLLLTSRVPPVGVPPPVNVSVFDPGVKVPLPAGFQALVTDKFVDPPRSRSKLPISRVATLTVLPLVKTVLPVNVRLVEEVVKVPEDELKSAPRTRVQLVEFKVATPPNVPPPLKVRILAPEVKVPPVGFQALVTERLVLAP